MLASDNKYVRKRKRKATILSFLFVVMRVFPIQRKKIVFSTYEGDGGFCCNPRYIAQHPDLKLVWLTKDTTRIFPDYIIVRPYSYWSILYHLSTAHIWIDNYRKPLGTLKRKKQFYLQTWHASFGFKAVGLYRGPAVPEIARIVSEWDSGLIDYCLSNSEYCDHVYPKKLLYSGPTLRIGSPRNDCLINSKIELHKELREHLGLDQSTQLVLFAPTFRGGNQSGKKNVIAEVPQVDFGRLLDTLTKKNEGTWKILLRLHPQLAAKYEEMPLLNKKENMIDVSQEADISEIMGGCDAVITDYSSCAFDAAFAGIPVFLFADDMQEYENNRGQLMWRKDELPFTLSENNDELFSDIMAFNYEEYILRVRSFMKKYNVVEDGHASEKATLEVMKNIL